MQISFSNCLVPRLKIDLRMADGWLTLNEVKRIEQYFFPFFALFKLSVLKTHFFLCLLKITGSPVFFWKAAILFFPFPFCLQNKTKERNKTMSDHSRCARIPRRVNP